MFRGRPLKQAVFLHAKKLPQPSLQQLILISLQFFRQVKQQSFRFFPA